jgi:hypothetical protein
VKKYIQRSQTKKHEYLKEEMERIFPDTIPIEVYTAN